MSIQESSLVSIGRARSRITHLLIAAVALITVVVLTSVAVLLVQHSRTSAMSRRWQPAVLANQQVSGSMERASLAVSGYRVSGDGALRTSYLQARADLLDALTSLATADRGIDLGPAAENQSELAQDWVNDYADPVIARSPGATDASRQQLAASQLADFRAANQTVAAALIEGEARVVALSRFTTLVVLVVGVLLCALASMIILRRGLRTLQTVTPPLEHLHAFIRARRSGDQRARADTTEGTPEVRSIAGELNELIDLNDRQRSRLLESLRLTEAVRDLGMIAGRELDLVAVLENTVEPLCRTFRSDAASIRAFEGLGEVPGRGSRATFPSGPAPMASEAVLDASHRAARQSWTHQRCVIIDDDGAGGRDHSGLISAADATAILDYVGGVSLSSLLVAGMGSGSECVGYLVLARGVNQPDWSAAEAAAAMRSGHDIGQAIMHARLFEREQFLLHQVRDLDAAKTDFVTTVSHELRTPLTSIVGNLELIRSGDVGPVEPGVARRLDSMGRNASRLTMLIEDLLLLSKIEDRQVDGLVEADLRSVVADALDSCRTAAETRQVSVEVESAGRTRAMVSEPELVRALTNVIGNAIKFSPPGAKVKINISSDDETATIGVLDEGIGISVRDQASLFGKFFRSTDPAVQVQPGTGLGLAVAKLIIDRHRGDIELRSELGRGTSVRISVPRQFRVLLPPAEPETERCAESQTVPDPVIEPMVPTGS